MKILYALQGTGNGHVSRATEIIPLLRKKCETDILISGFQSDLQLPFKPTMELHGLSFVKNKRGGIDFTKTYKKASIKRFIKEMNNLPVDDYDFIINDFEPVSAWACFKRNRPCIALSHQSALLEPNVPKPDKKDPIGDFILKNYAPVLFHFGFHFSRYSNNIFTPVIRKEIREAQRSDDGHYIVYLPAYDDYILVDILRQIPEGNWIIFSRSITKSKKLQGITITPVDSMVFSESLASCSGVLCGAGFETPAEALYLGKKLMVVPMKNQYEQHYNAAALAGIGIPVLKKMDIYKTEKIRDWISSDYKIEITYPDHTERILNKIFEMFIEGRLEKNWSNKLKMIPPKKLL